MKTDPASDKKNRTAARIFFYVLGICTLALGLTLSTKTKLDVCCVIFTCVLTLTLAHHVIGIGIGTLAGMFGTGRVIAIFNRLFGAFLIPLGKKNPPSPATEEF